MRTVRSRPSRLLRKESKERALAFARYARKTCAYVRNSAICGVGGRTSSQDIAHFMLYA